MATAYLSRSCDLLPLVGATLLGLVFLRFLATTCYNLLFHPLKAVPGPLLAKIFHQYMGPALVRGCRAQTLLDLHARHGPVVRIGPNEVSISDFQSYRDIYAHKASSKEQSFYGAARFLGHENIFSMRSKAQHAARRRMENQPYSLQSVNQNEPLITEMVERLLDRVAQAAKSSSTGTVDIYPLCGLFSLEVICKTAFNKDISADSDQDGFQFLTAMDTSAKMLPLDTVLPFLRKFDIGKHIPGPVGNIYRQFELWVQLTRSLFRDFKSEVPGDESQKFLATSLLVNQDDFLGRHLTDDEAVEEAMGIAFAGSGTTSTTLSYLMYNLSLPENQPFQSKLRDELQRSGHTMGDVKLLPYLNAVIKETLRLNPTIISTLPRVLDIPIAVPGTGVVLPVGTIVGMQNYVHHRDAAVYPDPHTFNPDRWIGASASSDMEKALTPFSLGPRNCIGQNLARAELWLATSMLFRRFYFRLSNEMSAADMEMEDRFNIAPRGRRLLVNVQDLEVWK